MRTDSMADRGGQQQALSRGLLDLSNSPLWRYDRLIAVVSGPQAKSQLEIICSTLHCVSEDLK
jgi:hypothetical protein